MPDTSNAEIKHVIDTYGDRLRASDVAGVVDLYTADAAVMQPDHAVAIGAQQLTAAYKDGLESVAMDFRFHFEEIRATGDMAAVRTNSAGTVTVRATGDTVAARYRELFVLERINEEWKIAQYMFQAMPGE
jgi:ketosteroid isomerase-like protein